MKSLRIKLAAVVVAVAALVAAPAAANAYTPGNPDLTVAGAPVPGGTVTLQALSFDANTTVRFTLTGENGAGITLAAVKLAVTTSPTFTSTANPAGTAALNIKLPSNASGDYKVSATGYRNGVLVTEKTLLSISTGGGQVPAATGVDSASLMGVWIGGGVLLLGGLAVTVFAVRRQRQDV